MTAEAPGGKARVREEGQSAKSAVMCMGTVQFFCPFQAHEAGLAFGHLPIFRDLFNVDVCSSTCRY